MMRVGALIKVKHAPWTDLILEKNTNSVGRPWRLAWIQSSNNFGSNKQMKYPIIHQSTLRYLSTVLSYFEIHFLTYFRSLYFTGTLKKEFDAMTSRVPVINGRTITLSNT